MKLSCSTLVFTLEQCPTLVDNLEAIKALGFEAVDIAAFPDWQNLSPTQIVSDDAYVDRCVEEIITSGLEVSSINCRLSRDICVLGDDEYEIFWGELKAMFVFADKIGCPNITIPPGGKNKIEDQQQALELIGQRASAIGALGRKYGITLSHEVHQGSILEDLEAGFWLMDRTFPNIGITYDPSHYVMQSISLLETKEIVPYSHHVHIRNARQGAMQAGMDDGEISLEEFVGMLGDSSYNGYVSIEYFNGFDGGCANIIKIREELISLGIAP